MAFLIHSLLEQFEVTSLISLNFLSLEYTENILMAAAVAGFVPAPAQSNGRKPRGTRRSTKLNKLSKLYEYLKTIDINKILFLGIEGQGSFKTFFLVP